MGKRRRKLREDGSVLLRKQRQIPLNLVDWKKPILIAEKVTQEPTADLTRASYGYHQNFLRHPFYALTINKISSDQFPIEDWQEQRDWLGKIPLRYFEDWVKERRDLFPKLNTTYYMFAYSLTPVQGKRWKYYKRFKHGGQHKNKWRALRSIASFKIATDERSELTVFVALKRGLTKGTRRPKRKNYLIWRWFGKSRV